MAERTGQMDFKFVDVQVLRDHLYERGSCSAVNTCSFSAAGFEMNEESKRPLRLLRFPQHEHGSRNSIRTARLIIFKLPFVFIQLLPLSYTTPVPIQNHYSPSTPLNPKDLVRNIYYQPVITRPSLIPSHPCV